MKFRSTLLLSCSIVWKKALTADRRPRHTGEAMNEPFQVTRQKCNVKHDFCDPISFLILLRAHQGTMRTWILQHEAAFEIVEIADYIVIIFY